MRLYLIRHGETDWNKARRLQGQADIPLNDFGRHLAEETGKALEEVPFDLAYTSPLQRASETARLVLGTRSVPVIEEPRIMEICFGDKEGICWGDCHDDSDSEFMKFFHAPEKYEAPSGGESFGQISTRLSSFLDEIFSKEDLEDKTILISTHGAALCGILRILKKEPLANYWGNGVHKNCAVTIIDVKNKKTNILKEGIIYYGGEGR